MYLHILIIYRTHHYLPCSLHVSFRMVYLLQSGNDAGSLQIVPSPMADVADTYRILGTV